MAFVHWNEQADKRAAEEREKQEKMQRDINADIEAVRSGKKRAGKAFHLLFNIPETPENTFPEPKALPAQPDAKEN
jgi:hypothetical protein